tara:strand:- start:175 stop:411 length:237 start_codon:yes stop_codon:yes gene_type:complete
MIIKNTLHFISREEQLNEYYKNILLIDNDLLIEDDIETKRTKYINDSINILEEYPELCLSKCGQSFLTTIIYPIINMR